MGKFVRFARFVHANGVSFGVVEGEANAPQGGLTVAEISSLPFEEVRFTGQRWALADVRLLAPIFSSKVVGIGRNYADHAAELGNDVPKEPIMFIKPSTSVIGPNDAIRLPPQSQRVEHEAELAVVIGASGARRVDRAGAEVGRIVRKRLPVTARVRVDAEPADAYIRLSVAVDNEHPDVVDGKDAAALTEHLTEIMPGRPTAFHHRHPFDDLKGHYETHTVDPLTRLQVMTIVAAEQQTMNFYMNHGADWVEPIARGLYAEIAMVEEQHVSHYESLLDPLDSWLKQLLCESKKLRTDCQGTKKESEESCYKEGI